MLLSRYTHQPAELFEKVSIFRYEKHIFDYKCTNVHQNIDTKGANSKKKIELFSSEKQKIILDAGYSVLDQGSRN